MTMQISAIAFSERGLVLTERMASALRDQGEDVDVSCGFGEDKVDHHEWTANSFASSDALVFVGAAGIAVRSIAPFVGKKTEDPAVIVLDERGLHCISLLSGHIGGANELARRIAEIVGADPVITTATDLSGAFQVDSWAVSQGMEVLDASKIKEVSSAILRGEDVAFQSEFEISGDVPDHLKVLESGGSCSDDVDISVTIHSDSPGLRLVPKCLVLGVGCKRGTPKWKIAQLFGKICRDNGTILPQAFAKVATIDAKADEVGLLEFCSERELELVTFSAGELNGAEGDFHSSDFVREAVGTDNVCERAVVCTGAEMLIRWTSNDGVTMAIGIETPHISWPKM
ncbi:MAG: cobalt-precorrin 5A hydrolase [Coriobacteriales bacterium]|jgi:cobalt-precorrin 5A hydrolase